MGKSIDRLGEFGLIDSIRKYQYPSSRVVEGIGDDAAVLKLDARRYQLLTTDMLVEGVHFLRDASARQVGHKALACNISDIAAMGGLPTHAVISLGLPSGLPARYVSQLYEGMSALARKFDVSIVGGDTVRADTLVINIALLGEVEKKHLVLRRGACPGDVIFVTGPLGNTLHSGRHLTFLPRVKEARFLVENYKPSAMMDISDGLAGDLGHLLKASRVGAVIDEIRIPLNPGAGLNSALSGGEDFELLFTLPAARAHSLACSAAGKKGFSFIQVGVIIKGPARISLRDRQGVLKTISASGYKHF